MGKSNYMERMRQYQKGSFKGMTTAERKDRYMKDVGEQAYNEAYDKTYKPFKKQYLPYKLTSEVSELATFRGNDAKKSASAKASKKFDQATRYDDMLGRATNPYQYQPGGMRMYGDPTLGNQTFSNIVYQESEAGKEEALKKQMEEAQADNTAMEEANAALQRQYSIGNRVEASGQTALQAGKKSLSEIAEKAGTDAATKSAGKLGTFASKYVNAAHAKAVSPYAIAGTIAGQGIKYLSDDDDATTMNFGEGAGGVISGAASGAGLGSILGPVGTAVGGVVGGLYGLGKGVYQRNKARNTIGGAEDEKEAELNTIGAQMRAEGVKSREYSGYDFGRTLAKNGGPRMYQTAGFDMSMLANNPIKNAPVSRQDVLTGYSDAELAANRIKGDQVAFNNRMNIVGDNLHNAGQYIKENPLDAVQVGLGGIAIGADGIPVVGTAVSGIADAVNAGISGTRAAYYNKKGDSKKAGFYSVAAGLDGLAAVPGVGNAAGATKMGMLLNKASHLAHGPIHVAHQGAKAITAGKAATLGTSSLSAKNTFKQGGVKLPGGTMNPIPGSDAVEFKGKSHKQGGILLDEQTEVEGGETMDKVTMKDEGPSDYFFSKYLKLGGQSFAQRHKQLLKKGGTQQDIDALAKIQEETAGRNPGVVEMERGGAYQYQFGGYGITNNNQSKPSGNSMRDTDPTIYSQSQPNYYTPLPMLPYPDDVGDLPVMYHEDGTFVAPKKPSASTTGTTTTATPTPAAGPVDEDQVMFDNEQEAMANLQPLPTIDTSPAAKGKSSNDDLIMEDVDAQIANLEAKKEQIGLTKQEERALKRMYRDVPMGAYAAGAAQMIPAAYAFLRKEKAQKLMGPAGRIGAPKLERADFNKERSQNAADSRALTKSIETSGSGPAGIIAKMAAYGRKQTGDMQIAASESRANAGIQAQEAQMQQQANIANVQNAMTVDNVNTRMIESQRVADENRKYMALDAAAKSGAGLMGDVMSYKADERVARSLGTMGIHERERLGRSLLGKVNPRTKKFYTREDIAEIYNINLDDPGITKEAEAAKTKE